MFDDFYGLTARPFQLTPDPSFYFESATHRKALSYLGYGLAQGEGFIVITGEVGAGKSTLVAHLMKTIDPEQLSVGHVVTSSLDGEELVHIAARSFGLEVEGHDKASALGAIENFLHEEARGGRRCLLVVDEAQNLSVEALEELRMLSNFQLGAHPLLQTLLLGQPEFKQMLSHHASLEQLRQRVIAAHHLEPMERSELKAYVEHRLRRAGWQGNPAFDEGVFAGLYEATGGVPRVVNQVMTRLLLLGAVEQRARIDSAMLASVRQEMTGDTAPRELASAPEPQPRAAEPAQSDPVASIDAAPSPKEEEPAIAAELPPISRLHEFDAMLAERDSLIAELQQAVVELSRRDGAGSGRERQSDLAALEARLEEQEQTLRHVLTMLIEWIEAEAPRRAA